MNIYSCFIYTFKCDFLQNEGSFVYDVIKAQ